MLFRRTHLPLQICSCIFTYLYIFMLDRDSVVGIATHQALGSPGIEFWVDARFSAPVQTDPGTHSASYKWIPGLFLEVKATRAWC